jgi:hypothetical protein
MLSKAMAVRQGSIEWDYQKCQYALVLVSARQRIFSSPKPNFLINLVLSVTSRVLDLPQMYI